MSSSTDRAASAASEGGEIPEGTRVQSRVFSWLSGVVVSRSYGGYTVRVDPEVEHHRETVSISDKEIITERDALIEDAQWVVDRLDHDLKNARANEAHAKARRVRLGRELRTAKTALRRAQRTPVVGDGSNPTGDS